MKSLKSYILGLAAVTVCAVGFSACQDDFGNPAIDAPVATISPNTTLLELKTIFWDDATNYIDTIGTRPDGSHYIIHGRVISSDEAGNVFKSLVIQDETAALALSINSYNLYLKYRQGQEVVIDATGMYIGKYNGLQQLGMPEWYANGNAWEATFMAPEFFEGHAQLNGFPQIEEIDTLEINAFSELPSNPDGLRRYQSQIVKFNNVYFENGGEQVFSEYHSSGVNQNIIDVNGSTLPVRTSGYSNFWNTTLPKGNGDVVCILSYYGTTGWQLLLNDIEGCMNFGNPTVAPGTEDNPYTVTDAIATIAQGVNRSGWVKGYIVGSVAPEVTEVKSNSDIIWSETAVLPTTLVIGATADTKDIAQALVISLPAESALRQYGNLVSHPENYKREIMVKGVLGTYMSTYGILNNKGTASEFKIEGVTIDGGEAAAGDGTEASPYNVGQVIAMNPSSTSEAVKSGVWVTGYIVGWADMSSTYYINAETQRFTVPATMATNILVAATPDVKDFSKCIGVQLPTGSVRSGLNLVDNPGNLGKEVMLKGDIMKYSGVPGMKNTSEYKLAGGGDTPGPDTPPAQAVSSINENFDGGTAIPAGWTQVQVSGDKAWYIATYNGNNYIAETGYKGTKPPFDQWLLTPPVDMSKVTNKVLSFETQVNGYGSTTTQFEVYVLSSADISSATKTKLNPKLPTAPASGYSSWTGSGDLDLSKFTGVVYIGFRYYATSDANYATWCVDNVKLDVASSTPDTPDTPDTPGQPVTGNTADFNTFNGGVANTTVYGSYSTTTGWTTEWALILAGGTEATNFISTDAKFLCPCLDGTPARPGKLISPTIAGGLKTLKFNYGFPYSESKVQFTVNIIQGGKVVASDTVKVDPATKAKVYNYSHAFSVSGDFKIEIVNDLLTQSSSNNKDRVAIWDLTWE